jgi:hypothetical protein
MHKIFSLSVSIIVTLSTFVVYNVHLHDPSAFIFLCSPSPFRTSLSSVIPQQTVTMHTTTFNLLAPEFGISDIIHIVEKKRLQWYGHIKRMPEERIPKLILEWLPEERRKRGKFRTRSMEKQGGMAFVLRKTATAVTELDR